MAANTPEPDPTDIPSPEEQARIDAELAHRHAEMAALYARRAGIVPEAGRTATRTEVEPPAGKEQAAPVDREARAHDIYIGLWAAWDSMGIEIPPEDELKEKLIKAHDVIETLVDANERLKGRMGILLVPPSRTLDGPVNDPLRRAQGFTRTGHILHKRIDKKLDLKDKVAAGITDPPANYDWRVLAADTSVKGGLYLGSPNKIIKSDAHMIGGYDTRGLGVAEYSALTLQTPRPIDVTTKTWLLKDFEGGESAILAGFNGRIEAQSFQYSNVNANADRGIYRYRAGVEIE